MKLIYGNRIANKARPQASRPNKIAAISVCLLVSRRRCLIFLHYVDISQSLADVSRREIILCFSVARILMATMKFLIDMTVSHSETADVLAKEGALTPSNDPEPLRDPEIW